MAEGAPVPTNTGESSEDSLTLVTKATCDPAALSQLPPLPLFQIKNKHILKIKRDHQGGLPAHQPHELHQQSTGKKLLEETGPPGPIRPVDAWSAHPGSQELHTPVQSKHMGPAVPLCLPWPSPPWLLPDLGPSRLSWVPWGFPSFPPPPGHAHQPCSISTLRMARGCGSTGPCVCVLCPHSLQPLGLGRQAALALPEHPGLLPGSEASIPVPGMGVQVPQASVVSRPRS